MASIGHLAAGAVCGAAYSQATSGKPARAISMFAALALLPDLDLLVDYWRSTAGTPIEHRVMTHSFAFALVGGVLWGTAFRRGGRRLWASLMGVAALGSHGVLDAMTSNGPGPQLLWPFSKMAVRSPWQPIPGTQTYQEYFSVDAFPVLFSEALLCVPLLAAAALILMRPTSGVRKATVEGPRRTPTLR